jgi:signal transduction histidine kinase
VTTGADVVLDGDGRTRDRSRTRRDWVVDAVVFVVVGLASLLTLVLAATPVEESGLRHPSGAEIWLDLAVGAAAWVSLWWRRQLPVTLGVLTALAAVVSSFAGAAALVMLLTVAIHRRWPWALLVGGVNCLAGVLFMLWWGDGTTRWFLLLLILAFGVVATAAVVGFGMFIRARRQLLASLRERAERAEAEQRRSAESARQGERTRIAREMHDVLAHRISLVSMHAGALEFRGDASADEVATAAGVIRENAHRALVDLREVIGVLRSGDGDATAGDGTSTSRPQPTLDALEALLEETRGAGVPVRAEVDLAAGPLPATTSRTAYRVLQEGLTNARKHGRGATVEVCVRGAPEDGMSLEVRNRLRPGATARSASSTGAARDDAAAGVQPPGAGVGLIGLAERTRLAGGRWEHGIVGDVFRLHVWLPWPSEATAS